MFNYKKFLRKLSLLAMFCIIGATLIAYFYFSPNIKKIYEDAKIYINTDINYSELQGEYERAVTITDRNNIVLATLYPEYGGRHIALKYEDFPEVLIQAVLSAEDKNFFNHKGIDYIAILRAMKQNIKAGKIVSGGSTITQQLAKSIWARSRSYKNKFYEMLDAFRLEKHLTKEEILTLYLNRTFFGNNCYGIGAAASVYFRKSIDEIDASEAAILASIIKSGTKLNPYKQEGRLEKRRRYVLAQMVDNNYLDTSSFFNAIETQTPIHELQNVFRAEHFTMYAKSAASELKHKEITRITTTLDYGLQAEAMLVIKNSGKWLEAFNVRNISCVILDAKNGDILTMIGSLNYNEVETSGAVNGATALRQPGSTLKPFLYAYLFENGESPASIIGDVKTYIPSPGGDYIPENFDRKFRGPVTIRDALANSLNVPAVRWLSRYRIDEFQRTLLKVGLSSIKKSPDYYGYALALGTAEVRLLDLTSAYTAFARDGEFINSRSIKTLTKSDGSVIVMPEKKSTRVFSTDTAYLINNILSDKNARLSAFPNLRGVVYPFSIAIKTGTSKGFRDAWAVGYTKDYVVGLWLGDFKGSEMINITGGNGAVPILYDLFSMLNKEQKQTKWGKPKGIINLEICLLSGKLSSEYCNETRMEVFSAKTIVQEPCDVHRLYVRENHDGSFDKRVFLTLSKEYDGWGFERGLEQASSEWTDTSLSASSMNASNDNMSKSANRVVISYPTQNSVYRIDSNLPIEYQKIGISASIPNNVVYGNVYCNDVSIGSIDDLKFGNIKWTLTQGYHKFHIEAMLEDDSVLKSASVNITVQ